VPWDASPRPVYGRNHPFEHSDTAIAATAPVDTCKLNFPLYPHSPTLFSSTSLLRRLAGISIWTFHSLGLHGRLTLETDRGYSVVLLLSCLTSHSSWV